MNMNLFITGLGYSLPTETKIEIMMDISVDMPIAINGRIMTIASKKRRDKPIVADFSKVV